MPRIPAARPPRPASIAARLRPVLLGAALAAPLVLGGCAARQAPTPRVAGQNDPRWASAPFVVMLSLDGFRPDYLDRYPAPNFARLLARGVRAQGMRPSYPSKTFPNHYTLVTGLRPEHHGLVANRFWDPARQAQYGMSDTLTVRDGTWYAGEPVWVTAERQGMVAASFFWPGSEADIGGVRPTRSKAYDGRVPNAARVDSVVAWLRQPAATRPHLVTLYFSTMDDTGHRYGPDAPQLAAGMRDVDAALGRLLDGLEALDAPGGVELLVVADHGMAWTELSQVAVLDTIVDLTGVRIPDAGPGAVLFVEGGPARATVLRDSINRRLTHGRAYLRADVPAALHYRDSPRIGDVVIIMEQPWQVTTRANAPRRASASHGWDPADPAMHAVFVQWSPTAPGPRRTGLVENVDVARYITDRLGLAPAPATDGEPGRLARQLREATP